MLPDLDPELVDATLQTHRGDLGRAARYLGLSKPDLQAWLLERERQSARDAMRFLQGNRRPYPPPELTADLCMDELFAPAPDVWEWMQKAFLAEDSALYNREHDHLLTADIGVVWTNVSNSRQMRAIAGTAEIPSVQGGKWIRTRMEFQLRQWFGSLPDFLITLDANYAASIDDATFCALCEHEMYHCAQAVDAYGCAKFRKDGTPAYAIRGHDLEEFVGIVRRYGIGASAGETAAFVAAANRTPEIARVDLASVCGTCLRMAG